MDLGDLKYLDAPAKVLKLSEAIRIGSKIRPQCTDANFFRGGKSCALGAAWEAAGGAYEEFFTGWSLIESHFRIDYFLMDRVASANDGGQTREQIADWLESEGH